MRICKSRDLRADEYEQVLRLLLKADETKNKQIDKKKKRFHRNYNEKFFTYMSFNFFLSSIFLFFDKFILQEKKVPTVNTRNALLGVYNFFSSP